MNHPFFKRLLLVFVALIFVAFLVRLNDVEKPQLVNTQGRTFERAVVTEIVRDNLQENGSRIGDQIVRLTLADGTEAEANCPNGLLFGTTCEPGMRVIVMRSRAGELASCTVYSYNRSWAVIGFVLFFFALLAVVGGKKGVKSVVALILAFASFLFFFFPLLLHGVAAGLSAELFGQAAHLTGYNVTNIESLIFVAQSTGMDVGGLLFSGILFASLGAVLDIAMDVSAAVTELHATSPDKTRAELFASGMRVGQDVMGTMAATLILAVFGGSLGAWVIDYVYDLPLLQLLNSNGLDIVLMQGLSGGIGVILTVPLAAGASAWLLTSPRIEKSCAQQLFPKSQHS